MNGTVKTRILTSICCALLSLAAAFAQAQDNNSNLIRGRLVDAATGGAVIDASNVWVQVGLFDPISHQAVWNGTYLAATVDTSSGEFTAAVPRTPQAWRLLATGYQTLFWPVRGADTNQTVVLRLKRAGEQPGVVLDSAGQPVCEFIDGLVVDDESGRPISDFAVQSATPDLQKPDAVSWNHYMLGNKQRPGWFSLQRPTPQRMWRIVAPGHLPHILSVQSVPDISSPSGLEIRLKQGGALQGLVMDDAVRPVAGAQVLLADGNRVSLMDGKFQYGPFQGSSTITDDAGRFALRGEGGTPQRVVVLSRDGQMIWPTLQSGSVQDMKITLPKPGNLMVRYNIPGDAPEAKPESYLRMTDKILPLWTNISFGQTVTVSNGGESVLTNLTPGTYFFRRWKSANRERGAETESQTVVVEAGRIAYADMVRIGGQQIRGQVLGPDAAMSSGGLIFVRSAEATGQPWPQRSRNEQNDFKFPTFEVSRFDSDGTFNTAMLKPGTYSVIAHVYPPQAPAGGFPYHPDYVGVAKVTVTAESMPLVSLKLAPAVFTDIAGHVQDDETGAPIRDFMIESGRVNPARPGEILWSDGYQGGMMGAGVDAGQFDVWNQKSGAALRFRANGYVPQTFLRDEVIASRQTANLQVRLKRGGELHGVVLDHAGDSVAHAKVYLAPLDLGFVRLGSLGSSSSPEGTVNYWAHTFATTDGAGRFSIRGVDGNQTRVLVATDDGQMVQPVQTQVSDGELKITLPKPATLIVHYDIPGDVAETDFNLTLHTNELEMPLWKYVTLKPYGKVPNGGQTVLTNLLPGTYDFSRTKFGGAAGHEYAFIFGDPFKFVQLDTRKIVLEPGQTQQVDVVRSVGQRVQGRVTGMESVTNPAGAFLYVGSAKAISNPNDFKTNNLEPCYDAVFLNTNGWFQTALLKPGKYTLIAEVYACGKPPKPEPVPDDEPQYGGFGGSFFNPQQLAYVGSTNITVTAKAAPPVNIELHPWGDL